MLLSSQFPIKTSEKRPPKGDLLAMDSYLNPPKRLGLWPQLLIIILGSLSHDEVAFAILGKGMEHLWFLELFDESTRARSIAF